MATTAPVLTHTLKCHCGKPAKKHLVLPSGECGNVCGIHGRKATEARQRICRGCGGHGATMTVYGIGRAVHDEGDWHRNCHDDYLEGLR